MAKLYRGYSYNPESKEEKIRPGVYGFECPGCGHSHEVHTAEATEGWPVWGFNGDMEKPTFTPSLLVRWPQGSDVGYKICHSFIKNGKIQFLTDCTHKLSGQTVDLKDV